MHISKLIKKVHLYLGLIVGFISSFSGLTGAIYVWQPELSQLFNSQELVLNKIHKNTDYNLLLSVDAILNENFKNVKSIEFPYRERQSILITDTNGRNIYYSPNTNKYLGENPKSVSFFKTLLQLHRNLCISNWGKYIIGYSSLIFGILVLGSGVVIWFKIYKKRITKGLRVKWSKNKKKNNFNIHKNIGIYFLIPLFILAITGAYFTFNKQYKSVLIAMPFLKQKSISSLNMPKKGDVFKINTVLKKLNPTYKLRAIYFSSITHQAYKYRFINKKEISYGLRKSTDIEVNPNKIITKVSSYENSPLAYKLTSQMYPIHIGESFGILHRFFVFIVGLLPFILYITGIRFYLFRKRNIR